MLIGICFYLDLRAGYKKWAYFYKVAPSWSCPPGVLIRQFGSTCFLRLRRKTPKQRAGNYEGLAVFWAAWLTSKNCQEVSMGWPMVLHTNIGIRLSVTVPCPVAWCWHALPESKMRQGVSHFWRIRAVKSPGRPGRSLGINIYQTSLPGPGITFQGRPEGCLGADQSQRRFGTSGGLVQNGTVWRKSSELCFWVSPTLAKNRAGASTGGDVQSRCRQIA